MICCDNISLPMATLLVVVFLLLPLLPAPVLAQAPGNLRLRGGHHPYEGRVEIFLNDQWGTICDDGWSIQDAKVTCRQLGFSGSVMAVHGGYYGTGDGEIWLDEVRCTGQESSLLTCENHMIDGQHDCSHDQDAGVVCLMPDMIQLVGDEPNQGRLEINHNGEWGTVCYDHFDEQEGTVVCQQLGYGKLKGFSRVNETKQGTIWLDDVNCSSSDVRLSECSSRGWGITDCLYSDAVSVACEGVPMEPYRPIVIETSCTNAMIQWRQLPSVGSALNIHHYYIRYREGDQSNWTYIRSPTPSHHGNQLNVTIYDLKPATSYEVAIAANNVIGNSSYSRSVTMVTQEIAFDPPMIVSVDNVGCGMLNVRWATYPSSSDECGLLANVHWVEYSNSEHTYHQLVKDASTDLINYTITNLSVNMDYNITVRVGMVIGEKYVFGSPSETFVASTKPTKAPVIAPGQLSVLVINVSTILFSWQCTEEYKLGYIILCYQHYNPLNFWTRNITTMSSCHHLEYDISNDVMFTCMVASFNEIGPSQFSDPVYIVPDSIPLNPTPHVTQWATTATSVTMTIEQGSHPSYGYVVTETIGYNVTCWSLSLLSHVTVWGSVVDVTVDKLLPGQNYTCDVTAISKCGFGNTTTITVTTAGSAPTGTPQHLFISDQVDALYLRWLPPATDQQHGVIIDYNVSCVTVEEGRDPHDQTLHDSINAWTILTTQLGYLPGNDKSINVAMPMFTPFKLISCRVAGINKNGQGPYKYYVGIVNPPTGVTVKVKELQANVTTDIVRFQWQPLSETNINKLAVKGYLLQCNASHHKWQYTVWGSTLSIATVQIQQFLTNQQYNCTIAVFNPVGFGLHSDPVQLQIYDYSNDDSSEGWYDDDDIVVYVLLSLIGVTMVIIVLLLVCLCYCTCHHRNTPYTAKTEIADNSTPIKTVENDITPAYTHYESLDNLYDKTPPPNDKIQPSDKSVDNDYHGDDELPAEEEYMKMTPSRSCSHVTIRSDTLRSGDVKLNQIDFGCQDNRKATDPHQDSQRCNSLPSHYDVPPNNSCHSNTLNNYYDTPRSNKLARTK